MAHVQEVNGQLGGPLDDEAIARLFERIIDEARRIQRSSEAGPEPQPTTLIGEMRLRRHACRGAGAQSDRSWLS